MSYITYKQADSRWGSKNYNGSSSMATAGCGPTSVAMLAYAVDGKTNPWDVAKFMQKNGYAIRNNGTAWSGIPAAMKHFGLKDVKNVSKMEDVWKYMKKGYCAVFLFGAGSRGGICWTTGGHYVAVTDYKVSGNKHMLYTRDSGGRNHTGWYCYETQMRGLIPQIWVGYVPGKLKDTDKKTDTTPAPAPKKNIKCIDVSDHQGRIDWKKVKADGVGTAVIRAGYGKNNADLHVKENIKGALAAGIQVMIYWFSYAYTNTMAKNEAEYCANIIKPWKDKIRYVYFDFEYDSANYARKNKVNPSRSLVTSMTKTFCKRIEELGYKGGFYYNYDYKVNRYNMDELKKYSHWYALYQSEKVTGVDMQQYKSNGRVAGISGNVDMNWIINTALAPGGSESSDGVLRQGASGEAVKEYQKKLNKATKGHKDGDILEDGDFGEKTVERTKFLQNTRHLKVGGAAGENTMKQLEKTVTKPMMAVNWANSIARDDSFAYGTGERARHGGCYLCGTNVTGPKKAKVGSKWEKTYCSNAFIFSAYAHGAGDKKMLAQCKKSNSVTGMDPKAWAKYGFKIVGKCKDVPYTDLKVGDVIMYKKHVWMYAGSGYLIEASGGNFDPDSIAMKKTAKSKYAKYQTYESGYVCRYITKKNTVKKEETKPTNTTQKKEEEKVVKEKVSEKSWQTKACEWAKKIAADNSYHYVKYALGGKAHECPVCHNHPKGTYHGWNCIGFSFACWHHGGGLKSKCSNDVVGDPTWNKIYKAKTDEEASKIASRSIGIPVKVIRNGNKPIPQSKLKKGDICCSFKNGKYHHTFFYIGDGKITDCTSGRKDNIKYNVPFSGVYKRNIRLAVRPV